MTEDNQDDDSGSAIEQDTQLRKKLEDDGFNADADGIRWAAAQPKILVAGAYKVIRTAAERANKIVGRGRE